MASKSNEPQWLKIVVTVLVVAICLAGIYVVIRGGDVIEALDAFY